MNDNGKKKYLVEDMEKMTSTPAPADNQKGIYWPMTPHPFMSWIFRNSRPHYHKVMTEIYHVLEGEGTMSLMMTEWI